MRFPLSIWVKLNSDHMVQRSGKGLRGEDAHGGTSSFAARCDASCAILKSIQLSRHGHQTSHGRHRPDPPPAAAHRLGQRVAAARRPADAGRHRPARGRRALAALEAGLRARRRPARGRRAGPRRPITTSTTSGLAATIARRSGATVAALDRVADYGERYDGARPTADRRFSHALMRHHGVPDAVIDDNEAFWDFIRAVSEAFAHRRPAARRRSDPTPAGATCAWCARPGHSTTDTLFVDDRERLAFVGDHLLAGVSSNTEIYPAAEPDGDAPARAGGVPATACAGRRRCR